ncbi:MAG: alpha/beta fold hydrolase [Gemmatimonadales bacterium]|nr:MAG: alpha/beta fold hydrolase [Gemmatimonadales bacterium]
MSTLAHRVVVHESPSVGQTGTLYILHGFLGSGRNWTSVATRLVDLRPDWRAVLVDLRLHGDSRGLPVLGHNNLTSCAEDLFRLHDRISRRDQPAALLGHSFGGKIALVATSTFHPPPVQTWVIDSTPEPSPGEGSSTRMLELLSQSPTKFASRDEAVAWVRAGGFDEPTARWMAMNLRRMGDDWAWQLDVPALQDLLADFARADLWPVVEFPPEGTDIRFVQAAHDSILSANSHARLQGIEGRGEPIRITQLSGGHWLHIDNPLGLLELLAAQLPRV